MGLSVAGSDTASRARSLTTDPGEKPIQVTVGVSMGSPPSKVSVLPPKEELPTSFEVKARILDFYPITLDEEDCLLRVCGDCKKMSVPLVLFVRSYLIFPVRIAKTAESCLSCSSLVHQAPVVFRFSLLFMLGTENGEELVAAAGNVDVRPVPRNTCEKYCLVLIDIGTEWIHERDKRSR